MTEEEIRPIAEHYVEEYCHCSDGEYTDGSLICAGIGTALIVARRLEKENAELKGKVSYLKDNLRVARKDRENLQLAVAKGLKEFVKDYPATALRYLANEKYVEQLTEAKKIIGEFVEWANWQGSKCPSFKSIQNKAEQFLKTEVLAVLSPKRTQNDPDKLTDDVMNDWKEMED